MHTPPRASPVTQRPASAVTRRAPGHARWWGWPLVLLGCLLLLAGDVVPTPTPAARSGLSAAPALFGRTSCRLPPGIPLPAGAFFDRAQSTTIEAVPHQVYCAYILSLKPHDLYSWYQTHLPGLAWTVFYDRYEGDVLEAVSTSQPLLLQILEVYGGSELRLLFPPGATAGAVCQMPADVPAPAGMQVFAAQGLAGGLNCILIASGDVPATADFYQRALLRHGWQLVERNDPTQRGAAILAFTKDSRRAYFYLFPWKGVDGPVLFVEVSVLCRCR